MLSSGQNQKLEMFENLPTPILCFKDVISLNVFLQVDATSWESDINLFDQTLAWIQFQSSWGWYVSTLLLFYSWKFLMKY